MMIVYVRTSSHCVQMEPVDPDFYRIGYARMMRAYGIEFLEGPDGMGVYASRDVEPLRRARVRHFIQQFSPCPITS